MKATHEQIEFAIAIKHRLGLEIDYVEIYNMTKAEAWKFIHDNKPAFDKEVEKEWEKFRKRKPYWEDESLRYFGIPDNPF